MVSIRKIKVVALLSVVATLAVLGSGRGQDTPAPAPPPVVIPVTFAPAIPRPPTAEEVREQNRARYVTVQTELSKHLTDAQLQERTAAAQKELTAAQDRAAKDAREKAARDELTKATALLAEVAKKYKGTEAGAKAQQALDQANGAPPLPLLPK